MTYRQVDCVLGYSVMAKKPHELIQRLYMGGKNRFFCKLDNCKKNQQTLYRQKSILFFFKIRKDT